MKFQTYQTVGFMGEIVLFFLSGFYVAKGKIWTGVIAYLIAVTLALHVGKEIEKNAIKKYQEGKR